jgi:hypothetical protein
VVGHDSRADPTLPDLLRQSSAKGADGHGVEDDSLIFLTHNQLAIWLANDSADDIEDLPPRIGVVLHGYVTKYRKYPVFFSHGGLVTNACEKILRDRVVYNSASNEQTNSKAVHPGDYALQDRVGVQRQG